MLRSKLWVLVLWMLVLAGCGGNDAARPKSAEGRGTSSSTPASEPGGFAPSADSSGFERPATAQAPPPPAPPSEPSAGSARVQEATKDSSADRRPGLGTEWGETRTSRVHDVTFVRDSGRPFAMASLHYNDRKGVDAQARLHAQRETRRDVPAGGGAVTVSIRDANGDSLEAIHVGDRAFVVGQAGQRYKIVLQNHTSHRFEAVATVDGLDVVNGKAGSFDNRGYVLLPFATLEIEGFRQSSNAVAAFRFAAVGESYAAQMGNARNVGVIGVAFFNERGDAFVPESELRTRDSASPFPADPRFAQPPRR